MDASYRSIGLLKDGEYCTAGKDTFGSAWLIKVIEKFIARAEDNNEQVELEFIGFCTDICVICNVLTLKTFYPELEMVVDSSCCAGSTLENHKHALEVLKACQVKVINE